MKVDIIALPTMDTDPRISVIVVTYMTGPALIECVQAVLDDPDIYELIIVDNGNKPEARSELSHIILPYDNVRVFQGHGNIGFSAGCNYGAKFAQGDQFLFLNPDAVLAPGSAKLMSELGQACQKPCIIGGTLRNISGREQRATRRRDMTFSSAFVTFLGLHKLSFFKPIHMSLEGQSPSEPTPVPVVSGAFMLIDKLSFRILSGFDESYFLHVEDMDICRRARALGGEVYLEPQANVMHYGSTSHTPRLRVEWEKLKGFIIYFWKFSDRWYSKLLTLIYSPFMAVAILGRAMWLTVRA